MKHVVLIAVVCGAFAAAGVTLPVCEVAERAQRESAVYPGRVVPVAQVDVVPQVSGEILKRVGTNPAERAFYRAFCDFNPLNDLGIE